MALRQIYAINTKVGTKWDAPRWFNPFELHIYTERMVLMRSDEKRLRRLRALFDQASSPSVAAELSREIRQLEKGAGSVRKSDAESALVEVNAELDVWLREIVHPIWGRSDMSADQLVARYTNRTLRHPLDGSEQIDHNGKVIMTPDGSRVLRHTVQDRRWQMSGVFPLWGMAAGAGGAEPTLDHAAVHRSFDAREVRLGFKVPGSHPDTNRFMVESDRL